ncbi:hypothetical protein GCK72_006377 [Caenorhabditis remanei]|nr:hypothetical protein GCK72_006373 [Caenorhabditis remanei]XP_053589794.1 hypothetical protein GCK72_006377 [Caenorhabditis remanei]KAF1766416.1 hypothetical protein GCK72_006373 [Caenorhabditis remanei]KAF1766420.1 hypothetical protein GCK72_006377 [Caenorhabditis remanei]
MHDIMSKPIGVGYAAPSVTTFEYQNPAYRVYEIDPYNKFKIVDFTTYSADLEKANENNKPVWEKLYSAKEAYGMTDLSPISWNKVIQKLIKSDKKRQQFYKYAFRNSSPHCDTTCELQLMCNLRMGHHNSTLYCPTF